MEQNEIILGFTDIKEQLLLKTRSLKSISALGLWFSYEHDLLYAHDLDDHKINIVLALLDPKEHKWKIYLKHDSYGNKLVKYIIGLKSMEPLAKRFNGHYKLYGFFPRQ